MEAIPHETTTCAECGEAMPFVGPAGGCPACMFAAASEAWADADGSDDPTALGGCLPPLRYGHFEIARHPDGSPYELGRGAMGISYLARDTTLDCRVALKVIAAALSTKAEARARFRHEARAAAKLRHPNVASVFHYGEQAGHCFYAMEFVEGETLEARVKRDGPLPSALALEIAAQVARALVAAETQGIIHRDLKPSNLMLHAAGDGADGDGAIREAPVVKVIDFGLAKAAAGAADQTRGFIGTPAFASPEQFADAGSDVAPGASGRVDIRSDIYSLGVTLWVLLTGRTPFVGRSLAEIHDRQTRQPLPREHLHAAGTPAPVVALVCRMLATDPAERPQTPRDLVEQIRRCQSECQPSSPPRPSVSPARWKWPRLAGAVIALLLLAALAAAGFLQKVRRPAPEVSPSAGPNEEKSVAVLPFDNLSDDKENAFFADGLQDDVIASLSKIRDLKVIGRASVMGYRGAVGADKLREISQTLGVRSLLEGTVRRANDRVVVSVHLTDPRDGRQLWGETYDRTLRDAISLQGELARAVADALRVALSPEERARLERPPTNDPDAYALYLQGEALYRNSITDDARKALPLLAQAIKLDPAFALARAKLVMTLATIYFKSDEMSLAQFEAEAMPLAQEAVRLQPGLAEAHRALYVCYHYGGDRERAAAEIEAAYRLAPNDQNVLNSLANSYEASLRYPEARVVRERLVTLDPQGAHWWQILYNACREMGDYAAAARALDRAILLRPDGLSEKLSRARLEFYWKGDLEPLRRFLRDLPDTARTQRFPFPEGRANLALWGRDYAEAEKTWERAIAVLPTVDAASQVPDAWHSLGVVRLSRNGPGDQERARDAFEHALPGQRAAALANPSRGIYRAILAETLACLGREAEARAEAEIAVTLMVKPTEVRPHETAEELAVVYARLKDADRALPLLEKLLSTPPILSVHKLRFGVEWDPIRDDPRFQALMHRGNPASPAAK